MTYAETTALAWLDGAGKASGCGSYCAACRDAVEALIREVLADAANEAAAGDVFAGNPGEWPSNRVRALADRPVPSPPLKEPRE